MKFLNNLLVILCFVVFATGINAQTQSEILATANGQNYTSKDLPPELQAAYDGLSKAIKDERTELLAEQIADLLFKDETMARKTTVDALIEAEMKKRISAPTETEIKAVYDANSAQIGNKTLSEIRPQIVEFLQRQARPKALSEFVTALKAKHKVVIGKDINSPNLLPTDVLATVNLKTITVQNYDLKAGQTLYEMKANLYDAVYDYLDQTIYSVLVTAEANSLNIRPEELIAREISNKLKDYSDEERENLQSAFEQKLYLKYKAKILLKEPTPFVQKISVDDDPSRGLATAPVIVVMFSDFQCPACSATHPVLQKVLAQYGNKIRFVVRDYPLTTIHNNSFKAAQAADAANAQGKFFEYIELLYNNQTSLDTESLKKFASQIGLNRKLFDADLDSGKFADEVKKDMQDGVNYGVNSTPTIFINGVKVRQLTASAFKKEIERSLKK
jgi:protein-disulfide isomerase